MKSAIHVIISVVLGATLHAQSDHKTTDGIVPYAIQPGSPAGSFALSTIENINPFSGLLSVAIPVVKVGGRGDAGYAMNVLGTLPPWTIELELRTFDCPVTSQTGYYYQNEATAFWWTSHRAGYGPGMLLQKRTGRNEVWDNNLARFYYEQTHSYLIFLTPDGTEVSLYENRGNQANSWNLQTYQNTFAKTRKHFRSIDGSGITFEAESSVVDATLVSDYEAGDVNGDISGWLRFPDGRKYRIQGGKVDYILDKNGNQTTFYYETIWGEGAQQPVYTYRLVRAVDSLGRETKIEYNVSETVDGAQGVVVDRITYWSGETPTAQHKVLVEKKALLGRLAPGATASTSLFSGLQDPGGTNTFPHQVVSRVIFDNSSRYELWYNAYGEVARLVLPTGGRVDYVHGPGVTGIESQGVFAGGRILSAAVAVDTPGCPSTRPSVPPWQPFIYRRVLQRQVYRSASDSVPELVSFYDSRETIGSVELSVSGGSVRSVNVLYGGNTEIRDSLNNNATTAAKVRRVTYANGGSGYSSPLARLQWSKTLNGVLTLYPDPLDGKITVSEVGYIAGSGFQYRSRVRSLYGLLDDGSARVCQEETRMWDSSLVEKAAGRILRYDRDITGSPVSNNMLKVSAADNDSEPDSVGAPRVRFSLLTDQFEYDWGKAPVMGSSCPGGGGDFLRRTHTDYVAHTPGGTSYRLYEAHLWSLPSKVSTTSPTATASEILYRYDERSLEARGPVTGRTTYPSTRGNLTSIETKIDATNAILVARDYDDLGNIVAQRDGRGKQTDYTYTDSFESVGGNPASPTFGFLTGATLPSSQLVGGPARLATTWKVNYRSGRVTQTTLPTGQSLKFFYDDPLERLTKVEKRLTVGDASPYQVTRHSYVDTPNAFSVVTKRALFAADDMRSVSRSCYDGWGREIKSVVGRGSGSADQVSAQRLDGLGRVQQVAESQLGASDCTAVTTGSWTVMAFDELDRVTSQTAPGGAVTAFNYQWNDRTATDPAGKCTKSVTDGLGRLTQVVEGGCSPPGGATVYEYDAADRLKSVTQGSQPPRSFSYDWAGRLLTALNPESGTTSYRYDLSNNLIWKKDGRGAEFCFGVFGSNESCDGSGYDGLNRPVKKRYEAATADWEATPEVTYCYDGQTHDGTQCAGPYIGVESGLLTGIHNGEARSEFVHDAVGRLLSVKRRLSGLASVPEFSYSYYPGDAMGEMIYPSGRRVRTCVDEWGRDKWVSGVRTMAECAAGVQAVSAESYASSIEYAAGGGLANWNLGTGRTAATAYNERNQPIRMRLGTNLSGTAPCGAQGDDWCIELGYGPVATVNNGNIREQKIWARKADSGYLNLRQSYEFDGLNRLTEMSETVLGGGSSGGNWTETNAYDRWGNRWATSTIPQSFLTPAAPDWIQSATNRVITARATPTTTGTIQYYAGGQVKSHPALGTLWKWDVEGQLRSVDGAQYFYDGEGRRVRKVAGGVTTYFAYDGMGRLGAEYGGSPGTGGVRYLTVDHLGSTRVVTDGSGAVKARCDYSAFGEVLLGTAGVGNRNAIAEYACGQGSVNQKFTGKERDAETGLDYFGARYMSAAQGRFTSPDPFLPMIEFQPESDDDEAVEEAREKFNQYIGQPQNWNRYAYAFNNPQRFIDPDGKAVPLILYAAGSAIGAAAASPAGQRAIIAGSQMFSRYGSRVGPVLAQSGQYISNAAFQLGPVLRGRLIETLRGVPDAFRNVRGIDNFDFASRTATSIKSLDIFAKSYQNPNALASTLTGYVQSLAKYQGGNTPLGPVTSIGRRILEVVLPRGNLTEGARQVLYRVQQQAAKDGVDVIYYQAQ